MNARGVLLISIVIHTIFGAALAFLPRQMIAAYTGIALPAATATASASAAGAGAQSSLALLILSVQCWWSGALLMCAVLTIPVWWYGDTRLVYRAVAFGVLPSALIQLFAQLFSFNTVREIVSTSIAAVGGGGGGGSGSGSGNGFAFIASLIVIEILFALAALNHRPTPYELIEEAVSEQNRLALRINKLQQIIIASLPSDARATLSATENDDSSPGAADEPTAGGDEPAADEPPVPVPVQRGSGSGGGGTTKRSKKSRPAS